MCTSASRNWPVSVCSLKPEPKETPGPNQLPIEMLREVLSYLPPRMLIRHCRPVCRRWRDVVDDWDLWRSILPWKHPNLWLPERRSSSSAPRRGSAEPRPRGCSGLGEPRPALPSF